MTDEVIVQQMGDLAGRLRQALPGLRVDFQTFSAGGIMLDVYRDDRQFLLYYMPSRRLFVVDEGFDEESFLRSYRFSFEEFEPAVECLNQLISGKIRVTPPTAERQAS